MAVESNIDEGKRIIRQHIERGVMASAIVIQASIKRKLSQGQSNRSAKSGSASRPGQPPAVMTGNLRRSIQLDKPKKKRNEFSIRVGTNVVYARIHEFGGVISASKGKFLTIPLSDAATRASQQGVSARAMKLDIVPTKAGGLLMVEKQTGKTKGKPVAHYLLVRSVTMPKRPYFRPGVKEALPKAAEAFKKEMVKARQAIERL